MLTLKSHSTPWGTYGKLYNEFGFICDTLECPWLDNKVNVSCIPQGTYLLTRRHSEKFKEHFIITGTAEDESTVSTGAGDRNFCLIHSGNWVSQVEGCILVGEAKNIDGRMYVGNSRKQLNKLLEKYDSVTLQILRG